MTLISVKRGYFELHVRIQEKRHNRRELIIVITYTVVTNILIPRTKILKHRDRTREETYDIEDRLVNDLLTVNPYSLLQSLYMF